MNMFVKAVEGLEKKQKTTTTNGMKARVSTANHCLDLFFKIGASRGKDILSDFYKAYGENKDQALRIALWSRDIREGAGERKLFQDILLSLDETSPQDAIRLLNKTPELGRYKDLFLEFKNKDVKNAAFSLAKQAILENGNALAAKWTPRKGSVAKEFRKFLDLTPKQYRKMLVELSSTVEQLMSSKEWGLINYGHVPSVASARYQKAFNKNDSERYSDYKSKLVKGEAKINASAVYPYDVIKSIYSGDNIVAQAQWDSLPNYVGDSKILPMVDVSGSMMCRAGMTSMMSCLDVAVSLGLYLADKNTGDFKDTFLTFSSNPELLNLKGNLLQKIAQMKRSSWGMSTNIEAAFSKVLEVAKKNKVPQRDMPDYILILSDMQFDNCTSFDQNSSAFRMIKALYESAGYKLPKIVFWNINSHDNVPVKFDKSGVALVSGFSPTIVKSVLAAKNFNPLDIMLDVIMKDRYSLG